MYRVSNFPVRFSSSFHVAQKQRRFSQETANMMQGVVAHMVERSLSMREVGGSIPSDSTFLYLVLPYNRNSEPSPHGLGG